MYTKVYVFHSILKYQKHHQTDSKVCFKNILTHHYYFIVSFKKIYRFREFQLLLLIFCKIFIEMEYISVFKVDIITDGRSLFNGFFKKQTLLKTPISKIQEYFHCH